MCVLIISLSFQRLKFVSLSQVAHIRAPQGALTGNFKGPLWEAHKGPICKMNMGYSRGPRGLPGFPPRIPQICPRITRIGPRIPQLAREFPGKIPQINSRGPLGALVGCPDVPHESPGYAQELPRLAHVSPSWPVNSLAKSHN